MKRFSMVPAALVAGSVLTSFAHAASPAVQDATDFQTYLGQCHAAHVCNGVYLVAQSGQVLFAGAVGDAGDPGQTPLTVDSAFDIGSVSKQVTAVAVLKLAAEGRFSVDDPVSIYLPSFPYADVTIAQLMTHTSGIPDVLGDYEARLRSPGGASNGFVDGSDIAIFLGALGKPPVTEPGVRFAYNNTGYLVLAALVEAVSGQPFAAYLEANLFAPLGMSSTRLRTPASEQEIENRVWGFRPRPGERRPFDQIPRLYLRGAGGVYTTAEDLLRWQQGLNGGFVRADLWARATAPAVLNDGTRVPYGFGLSLRPDPDGEARISHGGEWRAFKADLSYYPRSDLVVIQLTNNGEDDSVDANVRALREIAEGRTPSPALPRIEWDLSERLKNEDPAQVRAWFEAELGAVPQRYGFAEDELNALGYSYLAREDARRALVVFELATKAFPLVANSWDSLADAHEALDDIPAALEAVRAALRIEPSSAAYLERLEKLTAEQGR